MEKGTLYIIASPIGNIEDITLRAVRILRDEADLIYCEDTRHTKKILAAYGITAPAMSLHAHSSETKISKAVEYLNSGNCAVYMTDSGTPSISDPGAKLVRAAIEAGISVIPVPGPSALASAVSVSGFTGKNIIFSGFLSKKEGRRRNELKRLADFEGMIVVYESPYRIRGLLADIAQVFPESDVFVAREMTKLYEEYLSFKGADALKATAEMKELGEFTVLINNG